MERKSASQVFGIGVGVDSPAYVDRRGLDEAFKRGLLASRHVSVHGGSKQGKTWLRKKGLSDHDSLVVQCTITSTAVSVLEEALERIGVTANLKRTKTGNLTGEVSVGANADAQLRIPIVGGGRAGVEGGASGSIERGSEVEEQFLAQSVANLRWVSEAIMRSRRNFVIEDFHYLSESEQRKLSFWIKALGEYGCFVVVIGVWAQSHLLSYFNGDLEGRVDDIHLLWGPQDLELVLRRGLRAMHIEFTDGLLAQIVADSYGNVGLLHRITLEYCLLEGVDHLPSWSTVDAGPSLVAARRNVAEQMSGRFETFASNFVRGMRRMSDGLVVYLHLLRVFTAASDETLEGEGVDSSQLYNLIKMDQPSIRRSDLTQALERVDRLQAKIQVSPPVLSYHRAGKRVQLIDRSFLFFRKYGAFNWPWDEEDIDNDLAPTIPLDLNEEEM